MKRRYFPEHCECGSIAWQHAGPTAIAIVDSADIHILHSEPWYAINKGYIQGRRTRRALHRVVMRANEGVQIDHKNRYKADCRRSNLRPCSDTQNRWNRPKRPGMSQYKGVDPCADGRWTARICKNRHRLNLGSFRSEEEAARAYDAAARRLFGEFAFLNFAGAVTCQPD